MLKVWRAFSYARVQLLLGKRLIMGNRKNILGQWRHKTQKAPSYYGNQISTNHSSVLGLIKNELLLFQLLHKSVEIKSKCEIKCEVLPCLVIPVDGQPQVGVGPLDLDLVPLQIVQSDAPRTGDLWLAGAEVDVDLEDERPQV